MAMMVFLIPLFLLLGSATCAVIALFKARGIAIPNRLTTYVALAGPALAFVCSLLLFSKIGDGKILAMGWDWIFIGDAWIPVRFVVDELTCIMLMVITGIGSLIHVYSTGYMAKDEGFARFFSYLNLFMFFMLVLVLGDNLLVLFVGWEGVGLCSYLLIGFWWSDIQKAQAGMKAFIVNRIGDAGFILGMLTIYDVAGTLGFAELRQFVADNPGAFLAGSGFFGVSLATASCLLIFFWCDREVGTDSLVCLVA